MLLLLFYMYIVRMSANCHYHDVHMIMALQSHNKLQLNLRVIMACFTC